MIPYSRQFIDESDILAVSEAMRGDILTGGDIVSEFEAALSAYAGVKDACVVNSATSALHLAYTVLNIKDKIVLTTPITFAATANAALMAGASKVEFIDILPNGNINPAKLKERLNQSAGGVGAICVVDYGGMSVDIDEILKLAKSFEIPVIDDASHALGGEINGQKVGSHADLSIFSFHPVKPITTFEGGAVVGNNVDLIARCKRLRSHGIIKKKAWNSDFSELGFNYRLSDVACALGLNQLKKLDFMIAKRENIARFYDEKFAQNELISSIIVPSNIKSSRHLYPILLDRSLWCAKEDIFEELLSENIGVQVHYKPTYQFSFYKKLLGEIYLSGAEDFYRSELSIACHQNMSLEDAEMTAAKIIKICEKYKKGYCAHRH